MTWIHAQLVALLLFLVAHPAFYPFVVWPLLTGGISLAEAKLARRVPRLVAFAKSQGWDLGRAVSWAWGKLRARDPNVPTLPPGIGGAIVLLFIGAALAVPHLALADVLPDPHPGPVPSPTLGAVFGGLLAGVAIAAVAGWFMVRAARRERQAYADAIWTRRTTKAFRTVRRSLLGRLAVVPALALAGCAPFFAALPTVVQVVETAIIVLDQIDSWVSTYFRSHPSAATQDFDKAMAKTRAALLVLQAAAKAAKDVHEQDVQDAMKAFQDAYAALLELVAPFGVAPRGSALSAEPGEHLVVPAKFEIEDTARGPMLVEAA